MNNKLLIWDIDGTLINCGASGKKALNRSFYQVFDIKNAFDHISMAGMLDRKIISSAFELHNISQVYLEEFLKKYAKELKKILDSNMTYKVLPNVEKNLNILQKNNKIYNVVGTGNNTIGARLKLERGKLDQYFDIGFYGDSYYSRDALLKDAWKKSEKHYNIQFNKEDILVIGDTPNDIKSGKKNGFKTIGVATGSYSFEQLRTFSPDILLKRLPEKLLEVF